MIGTVLQPRSPPHHLDTVHVRQTKVQDHQVERCRTRSAQCRSAVGDGMHLVAASPQVDTERLAQLGLVLDDEDGGHALGMVTVMVRPPPGVWEGSRLPCMASVNPRAIASPRPTP
jgi:hypothetical protein